MTWRGLVRSERAALMALVTCLLTMVLVACAPGVSSPIGSDESRVCRWVREAVASGHMTIAMAEDWYPYCGPFQGPS